MWVKCRLTYYCRTSTSSLRPSIKLRARFSRISLSRLSFSLIRLAQSVFRSRKHWASGEKVASSLFLSSFLNGCTIISLAGRFFNPLWPLQYIIVQVDSLENLFFMCKKFFYSALTLKKRKEGKKSEWGRKELLKKTWSEIRKIGLFIYLLFVFNIEDFYSTDGAQIFCAFCVWEKKIRIKN